MSISIHIYTWYIECWQSWERLSFMCVKVIFGSYAPGLRFKLSRPSCSVHCWWSFIDKNEWHRNSVAQSVHIISFKYSSHLSLHYYLYFLIICWWIADFEPNRNSCIHFQLDWKLKIYACHTYSIQSEMVNQKATVNHRRWFGQLAIVWVVWKCSIFVIMEILLWFCQ